ncbi:hypothetical protein [Burkholderia sp. Ac-20379]|uniref:hypothetical protein n=1 Tax=Burkholderia sp. Ac-20379 TaxID=2703900 RepID=UPI00197F745A|nr:hypothetical protein [Burkholderia sp. Ac-20379]MBN3728327.1 hypothetical protein [Burkholderia sp. Ac-20379]
MRAEHLLPDGQDRAEINGVGVRKGTVGAFLVNARVLGTPDASPEARAEARADILAALPALRALGVFEVLEVRDPALRAWIGAQ